MRKYCPYRKLLLLKNLYVGGEKMGEKCRKAGVADYTVYTVADLGENILDVVLKTEKEKPLNERNHKCIIFGDILGLVFSLAKYEVNKNLCDPIGN